MSITTSVAGDIVDAILPGDQPFHGFDRATRRDHSPPVAAVAPVEQSSTEESEHSCADSLEWTMLAIVTTGASLFAAGMLRNVAPSGPVAQDGAMIFGSLAIAGGATAIWSVLTALVRLCRLLRRPSSHGGNQP